MPEIQLFSELGQPTPHDQWSLATPEISGILVGPPHKSDAARDPLFCRQPRRPLWTLSVCAASAIDAKRLRRRALAAHPIERQAVRCVVLLLTTGAQGACLSIPVEHSRFWSVQGSVAAA